MGKAYLVKDISHRMFGGDWNGRIDWTVVTAEDVKKRLAAGTLLSCVFGADDCMRLDKHLGGVMFASDLDVLNVRTVRLNVGDSVIVVDTELLRRIAGGEQLSTELLFTEYNVVRPG